MKSSGLRPDGSQTRAADVPVSTPRWTSAPLKKVSLKDLQTCPFVSLLVGDAFHYATKCRSVASGQETARNWQLFFLFFSLVFWNSSHDRFGFLHFPLCHSSETKSGRLQMHPPSTAFSIDTWIPRVRYRCNKLRRLSMQKYRSASPAQNLLRLLLHRSLQVESVPILPGSLRLTQDTLQLLVLKEGEQQADVCSSCV